MAKTSPPKRKSEFEMKRTPSPMRRFERAKNNSSTSSGSKMSGSKSSGSSLKERKGEMKEKSMKDLALGTREVSKSGKQNAGTAHVKNNIRHGRDYLARFKKNKKEVKTSVNASKDVCKTKVPLLLISEREREHTDEGQPFRFQGKLLEGKHPGKSCPGLSQGKRKREQLVEELSITTEVESDEVVKKRKMVVNSNDDPHYLKPGLEGKINPGCKEGASVTPADIVPHSSARSTSCVNTIADEKCEREPLWLHIKLLEGKHPRWKSCCVLSQGKRKKREPLLDELSKTPEVVKKRKMVVNSNDDSPYLKPVSEVKTTPRCKEGASETAADNVPHCFARSTTCVNTTTDEKCDCTSHNVDRNVLELPKSNLFDSEERRKLIDAQKNLNLLLKPGILKLCGVLQLSDVVKAMVEKLLEYVMNNHHVNTEPATTLQALQIALCWTAASFLKQKVDHKESLLLAKQHLNFACIKEEAYYFYSMLRCLKETFLHCTRIFKVAKSPKSAKLSSKDALKDHSHAKALSKIGDLSMNLEYLAKTDVSKSIKDIYKKFKKKMTKLTEKQRKDKNDYEEEKGHIEREKKTELAVIQFCYQNNTSMRTYRLKMLDKRIEEHKLHMDIHRECLEEFHLQEWFKLKEQEKQWVENVQSWANVELLNRSPSNGPEPWPKCLQNSEEVRVNKDSEDFASLREHGLDKVVLMGFSGTQENAPDEGVVCGGFIRTVTSPARPLSANGALDTMTSGAFLFTDCMEKNEAGSSGDDQENGVSMNPCAKELITDGGTSDYGEVLLDVPEIVCCTDGSEKVVTPSLPSFEECRHNADTSLIPDGEVRLEVPKSGKSTDGPEQTLPLDVSSEPNGAALSVPDREAPLGLHESASSSHNIVSVSTPSSEEQIHVVMVTVKDKVVESRLFETGSSNDDQGNLVTVDPSEEQTPENATYETVNSIHGLHNVISVSAPSSEDQIHVVTVTIPESGVFETVSSNDGQGNLVSVDPPSEEQTPENSTDYETVSSSHGLHNIVSVSAPSSEERIHVVTVTIPDKVVDSGVLETASLNGGQGDVVSVDLPSEEQILEKTSAYDESVSSIHGLHNVVSVDPPSSEEERHAVTVTMPDKEVGSGVLETVSSNDGLANLVSMDPPSSNKQISEKATEHETISLTHGLHNLESVSPPSSEERITVPGKEDESRVLETVSSNDGLVNLISMDPSSSEERIPEKASEHETVSLSQIHALTETMPDKEVESGVLETVSSSDDLGNLVSVDPPSSKEQNPEKATEKESSELHVMASNSATGINQPNGVDTAAISNSSGENPLVNSLPLQPVTALVHGGSVTFDQAHQDKGTLLATLTAVQCGDPQASELQDTSQPVENPVSTSVAMVSYNHSDHDVLENEPVVQVPVLPSSNTLGHSSPELFSVAGINIQPISEDHTFNQVAQAPMRIAGNLPDLSDQTILHPMTCFSLQQPVDIPTSGFGMLFQDTRATSVTSSFNTRPIPSAPCGASQMPLPLSPDPLQNELEKLDKEADQMHKSHEDMKLRLKSDCDKEIEEAIADIRRKYEIRFQETDAEFYLKKKESDAIRNMVLRNKILSLVWTKYMDCTRASSASGPQQDGNFVFFQHLDQLSIRQNQHIHSPVVSSSLASPPAARLQSSIASLPSLQATPLAPATNPHCTAPPMQSPAPFLSIPARPPHISSSSSTGIPQGGGEIRAPAPHFQPFRPSTSMSHPHLQPFRPSTSMPNWQSHSNSHASSVSLPHIPRLPAPMQQYVPYTRAHHPENAGGLPALSVYALPLIMDINGRFGANPSGSLPPMPNLGSTLDHLHLSDPAITGGVHVNSVRTGRSTDVVYLSDDD
ncbi:helicase protein MOM1-like isoform X1 [Prunus avium]|uniref:Helicase protein MOM1-like isoform X1 n=1 Tax=Prunus avium TaxID=42229 RepID=A0A6P5S921_PRUAV|nr:helicase protein MOM1-like isoform X1 [Prunus avium]